VGLHEMRQFARKFLAVAALIALLAASVPALAESLSASNLPACCNGVYCPLHSRRGGSQPQDKSNCGGQGNPIRNDSSMRSCDTAPNSVMETAPFVLVALLAVRYPASAEHLQIHAARFFPFIVSIPLTPPPRTLLS
jgi:hypothetical protein